MNVFRQAMLQPVARSSHIHKPTNRHLASQLNAPASTPSFQSLVSSHQIIAPRPRLSDSLTHFTPHGTRPPDHRYNSPLVPLHWHPTLVATSTRRYGSTTATRPTPSGSRGKEAERSWENAAPSGTPYLEAYEILEEFADVLLHDEEAAVAERAFAGAAERGRPGAPPLPASLIPGPKSWPLVGCFPYMLRHPGQSPRVSRRGKLL